MSKFKKGTSVSHEDKTYFDSLTQNYSLKLNQIETCFSEDSHPISLIDKLTNTILEFRVGFDLLNDIITFCERTKGYSKEIEKLVSLPIEKLNSLEIDFSNLTNRENMEEFFTECNHLLKNLMILIEKMEYFKILYNSNSIFKLQNFFLILLRYFSKNMVLASNSVNLIISLIKKGFDNAGSFIDILLTLIQDLITDKGSINDFAIITDLIMKYTSAIALKGLHQFENQENAFDCSNKSGLTLDIVIDNKSAVLKTINKITSFLIEKFKNTKSQGYKKFWKYFIDFCFSNFGSATDLMPSNFAYSLIEKFTEEIKFSDDMMAFKISFFELLVLFQKKQYSNFANLYSKTIKIINSMRDHSFSNFKKYAANKDCYFCFDSDKDFICESCEILGESLDKAKAKQKLKKASSESFIEHCVELGRNIRIDRVFNELCKLNSGSIKEKSSLLSFLIGYVEEDAEKHSLYDPLTLEDISVNLLQSKLSQNSQSKKYSEIYLLVMLPIYSRLLYQTLECCVILSNENSVNMRTKALGFIHEVCKINPKTLKENETIKAILENRLYDSSPNVRLLSLEILEEYQRMIKDYTEHTFNLILDRSNDISVIIRKNVLKFIFETLENMNLIQSGESELIKKQLFLILCKKNLDTEEISSFSKITTLLILFNSFQPEEKIIKRYGLKVSSHSLKGKKDIQHINSNFENGLTLLKYSFEKMGDEWYQNLVENSKDLGSFSSDEILKFIMFVISKLHNEENDDYMFYLSVLKPFSKSFSCQFIPELNYFYITLCGFNEGNNTEEAQKTRPYLKKLCEIIQNIILNNEDKLSTTNSRKFSNIEKELYQLVFRENLNILSASLKTICMIIQKISKNFFALKDLFMKCMKLVEIASKNEDQFGKESYSILRAAYIVSYTIKYIDINDLFSNDKNSKFEGELISDIYENFSLMIKSEKIELRRAAIECISCLWEKKPMLALKSKEIINNFIFSENEELKFQIFKIFFNILTEYRENNQNFFLKLKENFAEKVRGAKDIDPSNSAQSKNIKDMTSVVQLISESISIVIPKIQDLSGQIQSLLLKVILLLLKEGHCHVHTIFKKIFPFVCSENMETRIIAREIIETCVQRNSSMTSFELDSAIVELYELNEKKGNFCLFYDDNEGEKMPSLETIYEFFVNYSKEREICIRNPIDSICNLLVLQSSNYRLEKFICELILSLDRITGEDFKKWINVLNNQIQKKYQRVCNLFKSYLKNDETVNDDTIKKNVNLINSLFVGILMQLLSIKIARDGHNDKFLFSNYQEDNIVLIVEEAENKLFEHNLPAFVKLGITFSKLESLGNLLSENLDLINTPSKQNIGLFYQNLKILYNGGDESLELLEALELEITPALDKKSMSKKKKLTHQKRKEVDTPEKKKVVLRSGKTTLGKKVKKIKELDYPYDKENLDSNLKKDSKWESRLRRRRTLTIHNGINV